VPSETFQFSVSDCAGTLGGDSALSLTTKIFPVHRKSQLIELQGVDHVGKQLLLPEESVSRRVIGAVSGVAGSCQLTDQNGDFRSMIGRLWTLHATPSRLLC
jgi:hypothetical protein